MLPELHELSLIEKMHCPPEEKRQIFPLMKQIAELGEIARRDGVLSLEPLVENIDPPLLRQGLQMAVDGVKSDVMRVRLNKYALCGGKTGQKLLENIVIVDGMLLLANGENPRMIKQMLAALMGDDMAAEAEAYLTDPEKSRDSLEALMRYAKLVDKPAEEPCTLLEEPIAALDAGALAKLLEEVDYKTLMTAVHKTSGRLMRAFAFSMPLRLAEDMISQRWFADDPGSWRRDLPPDAEIVAAQERILDILRKMNF